MEDPLIKINRLLDSTEWTEDDKNWLVDYLEQNGDHALREYMERRFSQFRGHAPSLDPVISNRMLEHIHNRIGIEKPVRRILPVNRWLMAAAAACLVGVVVTGLLFGMFTRGTPGMALQQPATKNTRIPNPKKDILPGSDKAVLTLGDGSTVSLDDAKNGALAQQGDSRVLKDNGKISYHTTNKTDERLLYNTVATPRGGQYQVMLPDGTGVWLNAASSLRFPTAFRGKERRVEITGEAYFEVTKNASMPFVVTMGHSEVQVLGTHFNVMAYDDEAVVRTTLLEGAVVFTSGGHAARLTPGQQSQLSNDGEVKIRRVEDAQEAIAWKNGFFHFENADVQTVMRQLSRWYNVKVVYRDKIGSDRFFADIPRGNNLSDALKALELTGKISFEIVDGQIIVK